MKQTEEKFRRQVAESNRKENMLLMRLTQKETENHELGVSNLILPPIRIAPIPFSRAFKRNQAVEQARRVDVIQEGALEKPDGAFYKV